MALRKNLHHIKKYKGLVIVIVIILFLYGFVSQDKESPKPQVITQVIQKIDPTPTVTLFQQFVQPKVPLKDIYRIALLGDSMTHALGPHGGDFSEYMNEEYKKLAGAAIIVDNYADPSTNIQSLKIRLSEPLEIDKTIYPPIRDRKDLDLIIVESFAYNPLSHLAQDHSEKEHHRELRYFLEFVAKELPSTKVIFMSTIAPNSLRFASPVQTMSAGDRKLQVAERSGYLERHIELAGLYGIPVINVYAKSLTSTDDGDIRYINPSDYIHPSFAGIELIAREMTEFIVNQRILPTKTIPY